MRRLSVCLLLLFASLSFAQLQGGGDTGLPTAQTRNLPTGVAPGSACVSNGVGLSCVYQTKPVLDVRDFSGASTGAKIDAACASLAGAQGVVVIPSTVATGNSIVGISDNCHVFDYRGTFGPNFLGTEGSAFKGDMLTRSRYTTDHGVGSGAVMPQFNYGEAFAGGTNGSPKTNWDVEQNTGVFRTPGQHFGTNASLGCFSQGDCVGYGAAMFYSSRNNAGGDEGIEGGTWTLQQNSAVPTGTVSAISGTTITMNSQSNQNYLGEKRPLIITTPAKIYSTGTVSSISGAPPVLVGTGTAWGALCTTPCSPTDLFFALDADVTSGLKLVVPIRTVTDATHITLNMANEGLDMPYPTTNTGTYKIYKGGTVQTLNLDATLASVTVDIASDFAVSDTIEQPDDYWHTGVGLRLTLQPVLPGSETGLVVGNTSTTQPIARGMQFVGNFTNYFQFDSATAPATNGFKFNSPGPLAIITDSDSVDNSAPVIFSLSRNVATGGNFTWTYQKNGDQSIYSGAQSYFFRGFSATSLDFEVQDSTAVPRFVVNHGSNGFPMGKTTNWWSDNQATVKASINGATGTVTAATYATNTNCTVNSASPAACGAAAAGAVVVPTTTSTYTVNTSAVTAASRIFLMPMSFAGNLPSAPTCVAPAVTSAPTISAISAGVSFTFALPSTTGQTCWQYSIEN